jgi:hypothetical protein
MNAQGSTNTAERNKGYLEVSLQLIRQLDGLAEALFDGPGMKVAARVIEENGLYAKDFTPEKFIHTFMGYAVFAASRRSYTPRSAEEVFLIDDSQKFADYLMDETGIDLAGMGVKDLGYPSSRPC